MATRTIKSSYENNIQYANQNRHSVMSKSTSKIEQECETEVIRLLIFHENNEIDNAVYTLRRILEESSDR